MPLWIPITIAAAFLQNLRSTLQKKLTGEMSAMGATYVRFAYGLPVAVLYLAGLVFFTGATLPDANTTFLAYAALGGLAQIWGTVLLVTIFAWRNFAVGNTYSKTETIQTALFGAIVLGDLLSLGAFLAILVSLAGVVVISMAQAKLTARRLCALARRQTDLDGDRLRRLLRRCRRLLSRCFAVAGTAGLPHRGRLHAGCRAGDPDGGDDAVALVARPG